jgi:hypothetical protein
MQSSYNGTRGNGKTTPEPWMSSIVPSYRLGELLLSIGERGLTGRLVLQSEIAERITYFQNGFPVFAQSTQFDEHLGAVAIRHGLLKRQDVAQALSLSRKQGGKLGKAMLELGCIDGSHLFTLLGMQLTERIAASCGSSYARARFQLDKGASDGVIILRLHPMTAVLAAVRNMPPGERVKMFDALSDRPLRVDSIPTLTKDWLKDFGLMGDFETLFAGGLTVDGLRSRLIAHLDPTVQPLFDPRDAPYAYLMRREAIELPTAQSVAESIMLSLLMAGCIKLADSDKPSSRNMLNALPNTAASLEANLDRAASVRMSTFPESIAPIPSSSYDRAIQLYLFAKRERDVAVRTAIWGPGAETEGDENVSQLLTLYLTVKPEPNPRSVLALSEADGPNDIIHTHTLYCEFLNAHLDVSNEPLVLCKVAELGKCIDQAVAELIPDARELEKGPYPFLESRKFHEKLDAVFPRTPSENVEALESHFKREE